MKPTLDALYDYLEEHRLKLTPQRMTVLAVFRNSTGHLSTEELYDAVKAVDPDIGMATVYRTLKLLADADIARMVDLGDNVVRYELAFGKKHHDHIICEHCRKTIEAVDPEIERLQEELARRHGFTLTGHKMYLYGLCPECRKKSS